MATNLPDDAHGEGSRLPRQQQEIWADAAVVEGYAKYLGVEEFGGVWFDNDRDPVVYVLAVTDHAAEHAEVLLRLVEHPDRVEVVHADRSESALRSLRDDALALVDEYPISMAGLDVPAGVVVVGLSRDDAEARAAIERRFGPSVRVRPGTWRAYAV